MYLGSSLANDVAFVNLTDTRAVKLGSLGKCVLESVNEVQDRAWSSSRKIPFVV